MPLVPEDAKLLRDLLEWQEVNDPDGARVSTAPFAQMLEHDRPLTAKQRQWAQRLLASLNGEVVYTNDWSSGKVPRGREVETPPMLKRENLPLRPPGRR